MDLTISKDNVHIIIVIETAISSLDKLDIEVCTINLDDPDNPIKPLNDSTNFSSGLAFNFDDQKFLDSVVI